MKYLIRICCRLGFVVFQDGAYRFLGGRKLKPQELYYVEHVRTKYEVRRT